MSFLNLEGKTVLVVGVANRKSVAYHIARGLLDEGARLVLSVRDERTRHLASEILPGNDIYVCDLEREEDIARLAREVGEKHPVLHGLVHSVAFANYSEGLVPYHETRKADFLQAVDISCFSLIALSNRLKGLLAPDASVVTISISTTRMAAENYGYMAPIKAALDSTICFLAKSFSRFSRVRFNSVNPGLLKTSASAGIPGYIESYLFAEQITLRKEGVKTSEVANAALFLLSERSSGINARGIVVDAGMSVNAFDADVVRKVTKGT